jgi:hypothetical protein
MDIGVWLRSLGLERGEAAFRENEIDDTVLPTVTAKNLKDLGVRLRPNSFFGGLALTNYF